MESKVSMKKKLALLMVSLIALGVLAGCGDKNKETPDVESGATTEQGVDGSSE